MAIAFVGAGTVVSGANNVANPTTLSPVKHASTVSGNVMVCLAFSRSITATVATPTGWTVVSGFPKRSGTASGGSWYAWTRTADGSGSDAPSVSWSGVATGTTGDGSSAVILSYSGMSETLDGTVQVSDLAAQTSTSVIPAFTTATNGSQVIGAVTHIGVETGTSTVATFTERVDSPITSGTGHVLEVSDKAQAVAGSSGTATVTWSVTTSSRALAVSMGFQPAAAPNNWTQPVNDTGTWADALGSKPVKGLAESPTIADAIIKKPKPRIADTGTWADAQGNGVLKTSKPARYIQTSAGTAGTIDVAPGGSASTFRGSHTVLCVCRPLIRQTGVLFTVIGTTSAPTTDGPMYLYLLAGPTAASGTIHLQMTSVGNVNQAQESPTLRAPHDQWCVVGYTKTTGTTTPRFHLWTQGGGWQHEDASGTIISPTADITAMFLGYSTFITTRGYKAAEGIWGSALSDASIEALPFDTPGWLASGPTSLWEFSQNSSSDALNDLTGGGATVTGSANTAYSRAPGLPWRYQQDYGPYDDLDERLTGADAVANAPKKAVADTGTWADNINHFWASVLTVIDSGTWADAVAKAPKHPVADTGSWVDGVNQLVGHFLTQPVNDTGTWADARALKPVKALADTGTWADASTRKPGKGVADTGALADTIQASPHQIINDVLTALDARSIKPGKAVADTGTWADARSLRPGPGIADTGAWADARSLKPGKAVADTGTWADAVARLARHLVADVGTWADQATTAGSGALSKNVSDTLTATDALVRVVGKTVFESLTGTDASVRKAGKFVVEALTIADAVAPGGGKLQTVSDTLTATDALAKSATHPFADTGTWADALSRKPGKRLADAGTLADTITMTEAFALAVMESLTVVDALRKSPARPQADAFSVADALGRKPGKAVSDAASIGDAVSTTRGLVQLVLDALTVSDSVVTGGTATPAPWYDARLVYLDHALGDNTAVSDGANSRVRGDGNSSVAADDDTMVEP